MDEETRDLETEADELDTKIPWHFWLIIALAGIYLGFRLIEFTILGFKAIF